MQKTLLLLVIVSALTAGCFNLATPPSQISGAYTSEVRYQNYTCEQLSAELSSLARRENQLVVAQEQRRQTSMIQAFWIGYGNGDGIEAAELANVRGEKEAVRKAIDMKGCGTHRTVAPRKSPAQASGPLRPEIKRDLETIEQWRAAGILTEQEAEDLRQQALHP